MILKSNGVKIAGVGSAVPLNIVPNSDLVDRIDSSDVWIEENLGIRERRISNGVDESSSKLGAAAAHRAILNAGISAGEVGGIIVATATPDQKAPSTACLVQGLLGISNQSFAFDVSAVCSGFVYGLTIAAGMIEASDVDNIVVIGVDTFSTITNWEHRSSPFFGDGAGAIVMQRCAKGESEFSAIIRADGSGHEGFFVGPSDRHYTMNQRAVFDTATKVLPEIISDLLKANDVTIDKIQYIVPHQPSIRVLNKLAEALNISEELVLKNMDKYANTAGASIPLLLSENIESGKIQDGDLILMAGVGSGWTWGAVLYRWID
jgi:3-oxoacyl-[acyl-carrier-protein] synthase III